MYIHNTHTHTHTHTHIYIYIYINTYGLPWWLSDEESACNSGAAGSIPGSGRSPREGMATRSSILAFEIPWTEEPGGLHVRSQRVGHD